MPMKRRKTGSAHSKVLCTMNGKPIMCTELQYEKITKVVEYIRQNGGTMRQAVIAVAEEMGVIPETIWHDLNHKKLKEPSRRLIEEARVYFVKGIKNIENTSLTDLKNFDVSDQKINSDDYGVLSIGWIVKELKTIYDVTTDDRLKKDILVSLTKINAQYGDTLSKDIEAIASKTTSELIEGVADILIKISGNEFTGEVVRHLLKTYAKKYTGEVYEKVSDDKFYEIKDKK